MRAIILAGGKGTRLAPYTTIFPKPLVPVGDMPILEIVIQQLKHFGITEITLAVGHLAHLIMTYFGDGSRHGVHIHYSQEVQPLGTAGPLALIVPPDDTFLVMNGDLLTTMDFASLVAEHQRSRAIATIATIEHETKIDLGLLQFDSENRVIGYLEKPTLKNRVSMGIYAFEPSVLNFVPKGVHFDLPDLILTLVRAEQNVRASLFDGFWLDIGRPADYEYVIARSAELVPHLLHRSSAPVTTQFDK